MTSISRYRCSSPTTGEAPAPDSISRFDGPAGRAMTAMGAPGREVRDHVPALGSAFPEAAALGLGLIDAGLTIAVAESCTGGLLGAALTAIEGASAYVRGGVIAYADDVKAEHLGVGRHLLATHGAVSPEVAEAMASGVRLRYGASLGVGITGVAGPDASEHKPPGLIFVAVADERGVRGIRVDEDRGREANRAHAVRAALLLCADVVRALRDTGAATPGSR